MTISTAVVAIFFLGMGLLAFAAPERISAIFGTSVLPLAGRNEVRAVYGGFGVAIACLLAAAPSLSEMTRGIHLTVAVALAGMAGGRLVSAVIERPEGFYPCWFYFVVEIVLAGLLLSA